MKIAFEQWKDVVSLPQGGIYMLFGIVAALLVR